MAVNGQVVAIDNEQVTALLNNPTMRRKFPFLATAFKRMQSGQSASASCGGCRGKNTNNAAEIESIKKSVATMSVENKALLKAELGARQVVVKYRSSKTRVVTLKF